MSKKLLVIIGSGGFGHKIPFLYGTLGTAEGLLIYLGLILFVNPAQIDLWVYGLIVFFTLLSLLLGGEFERYFYTKDPHPFVLDEVAGFLCAVIFLTPKPFYIIMAFVLFRIFDIWKPFPIRKLQDLPAGVGIVTDDLLAGLYANICCQIIIKYFI